MNVLILLRVWACNYRQSHTEKRTYRISVTGRRGDAVKLFIQLVQVPAMQWMPIWSKLKAVAHTLPYDLTIMKGYQRGKPLLSGRWSKMTIPTIVMDGGVALSFTSVTRGTELRTVRHEDDDPSQRIISLQLFFG